MKDDIQGARLSASGTAALLLLAAAVATGFAALAWQVTAGATTTLDRAVLMLFRSSTDLAVPIGMPWVREAARDVTALGSVIVLGFVVFATMMFLLLADLRRTALFFFVTAAGGQILSSSLKFVLKRVRPEYATNVYTASFPSGHAMMSMIIYLTLAALVARVLPPGRLRIYVFALAIILAGAIGLSRVYLGFHWPMDVLGGWSLGLAWTLLCFGTVRLAPR